MSGFSEELQKLAAGEEPSFVDKVKAHAPSIAGLGAAAAAAPLAYKAIRKPTFSTRATLRAIQKKSKGELTRVIPGEKPGLIGRLKDRLLYDANVEYADSLKGNKPKKVPGAVHHYTADMGDKVKGDVNPLATPGIQQRYADTGYDDKWKEFQHFNKHAPGSMPNTENMHDVLSRLHGGNIPKTPEEMEAALPLLQQHLREKYPKGFVMKEAVGGYQSAGAFPSEKTDFANELGLFRKHNAKELAANAYDHGLAGDRPGFSGRVLHGLLKDPKSAIVQEKVPIERQGGAYGKLISKQDYYPTTKETRVHVVGGEAIPGMAHSRYLAQMSPEEIEKARLFAQDVVDKLPEEHRGDFGMDIASLEGGGHSLIESNMGGESGFLHPGEGDPRLSFKLRKAMTGQWSPTVAGVGALGAAGTAGVAGAGGTLAAQKHLQNKQQ